MPDYPAANDTPRFSDIKAILNSLIHGHILQHLKDIHNEPNFGWDTLEQLRNVVIRPDGQFGDAYPLIDLALVEAGRGDETNLVKALRDPAGVNSYGQMPYDPPPGRYASSGEIADIVAWLNAGMPE